MDNPKHGSLKKRYAYKLMTNVAGFAVSFITGTMVPRGLGPKAYGEFNFLNNFFNEVTSFFDTGSSLGFYTKLSQRPREFGLVSFYFRFVGAVSLVIMLFVLMAHLSRIYPAVWPEQNIHFVYMAAVLGILAWTAQLFEKMADAYGVTVYAERAKVVLKFIGLGLIAAIFFTKQLNLRNFFCYNYVLLLCMMGMVIGIMEHYGHVFTKGWALDWGEAKKYLKEFYRYTHPLFVYSLCCSLLMIFDRWLLQVFSGSIQQGFYGISYQIGAICFLFTSAMTPLIMREFSIACEKKDHARMAHLFRRYVPLLYSLTAFFACFVAIEADKVIYIFGGNAYKNAFLAVTIMAFFPIHQTYGQMNGSLFYATDRTRLWRNLGIVLTFLGLPVTYFLIAPVKFMGLHAGATGLALKMVMMQVLAVNVQLYFNTRFLKIAYWKYFLHQIINVGCLVACGLLAKAAADRIGAFGGNIIVSFILAGVVYTLVAAGIVSYLPAIFGLTRKDIKSLTAALKRKTSGAHG